MDLEFDLSTDLLPQQSQRVSPRLVAASYILELSSQELQQAIAEEMSDNPALDMVDFATCPACGAELKGSICPACIQRQKVGDPEPDEPQSYYEEPYTKHQPQTHDDEFDPLTQVASEQTLAERLLADLGAIVETQDMPIAEFLVGSLDEKGYLTSSVDEVVYKFNTEPSRVERVLRALQGLDPVGIGARSLRECLLLQLDHLERIGLSEPYAREIISGFLMELGEHKFARIAHQLHISQEQVAAVWEFVKRKLNPNPAYGFSATNARDRDTRSMYVIPDVVIRKGENGLEVEVIESRRFVLRINPVYSELTAELQRDAESLSADDKRHIRHYVNRARLFIANINQRRQTLYNITHCLAEMQRDFLEHGIRHLLPLSRAAVAEQLEVHESTVSRATAAKHVLLPSGEVIPFSHFFTPSLSIKDVIKELIEKEGRPLTDAQISDRLRESGIHIARRTVAKYRMQLDILPSSLR